MQEKTKTKNQTPEEYIQAPWKKDSIHKKVKLMDQIKICKISLWWVKKEYCKHQAVKKVIRDIKHEKYNIEIKDLIS